MWTIHEMEITPQQGPKFQHWKIHPSSAYVEKYLIVGYPGCSPVLISGKCPPKDVDFESIKIYTLPSTGPVTLYTGHYLPASANEATFDSFYYEANRKQATVLQVVLPRLDSTRLRLNFDRLRPDFTHLTDESRSWVATSTQLSTQVDFESGSKSGGLIAVNAVITWPAVQRGCQECQGKRVGDPDWAVIWQYRVPPGHCTTVSM